MRVPSPILISWLLVACGEEQVSSISASVRYRDTAITSVERIGDLFVERYCRYGSLGEIEFETAQVSTCDSIPQYSLATNDGILETQDLIAEVTGMSTSKPDTASAFTYTVAGAIPSSAITTITFTSNYVGNGPSVEGVLKVGPYNVWVPSTIGDTLQQLMSIVGMGNYLCFLDTVHLKDAYVVERRIEGYGTYENAGFLIIPSRRDTVGLWALVDRELPKPAAWEWNGLVPMTLEEYRAKLKEINALSDGLASLDVVDSILRNRSTTVQVKRLTR